MKTLIFYKSYLGATKLYANWLKEALGAEVKKFNQFAPEAVVLADIVVVMSGTYASRMPLTRFLSQHWGVLQNKRVYVVAVGGAPASDAYSQISYNQIPELIRDKIKYWKVPGKFGPSRPDRAALDPIIKSINDAR